MRTVTWLVMALTCCISAQASDGMPWEEFNNLYRKSIEQEILEKSGLLGKKPQIHSIDETRYRLTISATGAVCEVALSGKIVSGDPDLIPLFGKEAVLSGTGQVTGGTLMSTPDASHIAFLPDENTQEFQISATFLLRLQEEDGAHVVSFTLPASARNALELTLPPGTQLADEPGIPDSNGVYHFSARPELRVKFYDKDSIPAVTLIEIDTVTQIRIDRNRLVLLTCFQPLRPVPESLVLQVPTGAQYLTSTLKTSHITQSAEDQYKITFPANEQAPFSITFAIEDWSDAGEITFPLPTIEGNTETEGRFTVEEPDDGQVTVSTEGMVTGIPIAKLGGILGDNAGKSLYFMKTPPDARILLAYKPFQTVSAPATVLDSQELFVSFEENGNVLSVLRMDIPPEVGTRMTLKAVKDAQIWSLTVNSVKQSVYSSEQDMWILPLDGTQVSHVELAFLRRGPKLALQGTLDALMPETGLPSRELRVGIALPPRVNLLSLEGPVSPAPGEEWQLPAEFLGKPHFFSMAFFSGEAMNLALSFKEPVNPIP